MQPWWAHGMGSNIGEQWTRLCGSEGGSGTVHVLGPSHRPAMRAADPLQGCLYCLYSRIRHAGSLPSSCIRQRERQP